MFDELVTKEENAKLPHAGKMKITWQSFWFKNFYRRAKASIRSAYVMRSMKYITMLFYMEMRGANFKQIWIGPISIVRPMRWLRGPANTLHPNIMKSDK